ncbi:MAG: DUF1800 family protein [Gammaproteobacteria bacterium]
MAASLLPGLPTVSNEVWDDAAVRRVLHTFAYGGQATDYRIAVWAKMAPAAAIEQILKFSQHNPLLSRPHRQDRDGLLERNGSLRSLTRFWASSVAGNGVPSEQREQLDVDAWGAPFRTWLYAARMRGLNPFRHKIGLWETNYHMAVNLKGLSSRQVLAYYDEIMAAHARYSSYHEVMNRAALSAAVARQYGHLYNRYKDGVCHCNEDFAREYHQLFFGIFGAYDPVEHEEVTIKNTAAALSHMRLIRGNAPALWQGDKLEFKTRQHPDGPLRILQTPNFGRDAEERISGLSPIAIEHPESLDNLPVKIVRDLADDDLSNTEIAALRRAWRSMKDKDLLRFLRAYAVSTLFHSKNRVKRWTSIDRHLLTANLYAHRNAEHYADTTNMGLLLWFEEIRPFHPLHDVFGHQTGPEAAASADIFRKQYAISTERGWRFLKTSWDYEGGELKKDWRRAMGKRGGRYSVEAVAKWLWRRFIADGLKNYGPLEQAHLHALLATGDDIALLAHPSNIDKPVTVDEIASRPSLRRLIQDLGNARMALNEAGSGKRAVANERIGQAINFITATPYMFAQEGR